MWESKSVGGTYGSVSRWWGLWESKEMGVGLVGE